MTWDTSMIRTPPSNRLIASVPLIIGTDDFNRANGPLGVNWGSAPANPGVTNAVILSNRFAAPLVAGKVIINFWNTVLPQDQFMQFTWVDAPTQFFAMLRGSFASYPINYYAFSVTNFATGSWVFRNRTGTFIHFGTNMGAIASSDLFKFEAVGTQLSISRNGSLFESAIAPSIAPDGGGVSTGFAGFNYPTSAVLQGSLDNFSCGGFQFAIL